MVRECFEDALPQAARPFCSDRGQGEAVRIAGAVGTEAAAGEARGKIPDPADIADVRTVTVRVYAADAAAAAAVCVCTADVSAAAAVRVCAADVSAAAAVRVRAADIPAAAAASAAAATAAARIRRIGGGGDHSGLHGLVTAGVAAGIFHKAGEEQRFLSTITMAHNLTS